MAESKQISMDDILTDELPPPEKPEKPDKPEAEPKPEAAAPEKLEETQYPEIERVQSRRKAWRDKEMDARGLKRDAETGQFVPKEAVAAEPEKPGGAKLTEPEKPAAAPAAAPQQEMSDKEKAFLHAMQEERQKRQELERRLQAIETAKSAEPGATEQPQTFWDDPEGFLAKHNENARREALNTRLQVAETFARKAHTDFDEKIEIFGQLIQSTPGLREQWLKAADPAEYAYAVGRNHLELQQVGSIDALREKVAKETETRVRAQLEAEMKAKAEELARQRDALPPSLSEARNTAPGNRPIFSGPTSMDDILSS